jgi:hypothetical protein
MIRTITQADHNKVPELAFHSMNLCEDFLVIYGGMKSSDKISGDLILLKKNKSKFLLASYDSNRGFFPEPRHSHSAIYHKPSGILFIFGGATGIKQKFSDQLWGLRISSQPEFELFNNDTISPRCRSATFMVHNRMYIYGGFGKDRISKKFQILNDMYYYDIGNQTFKYVITKGGVEMQNYLFKCVRLNEDSENVDNSNGSKSSQEKKINININISYKFAFFCSNLSQFFIFDIKTDTFTKIRPKFFVHQPRENFIVEKLSDGRIVLFGGMEEMVPNINNLSLQEKKCYNEAFVLHSFYYTQGEKDEEDFHYTWTDIDLFEGYQNIMEEGYNGHASVVLENDHILIFGGTTSPFSPIFNLESDSKCNQIFTNRLKTIDIFNTYRWLKPESIFLN